MLQLFLWSWRRGLCSVRGSLKEGGLLRVRLRTRRRLNESSWLLETLTVLGQRARSHSHRMWKEGQWQGRGLTTRETAAGLDCSCVGRKLSRIKAIIMELKETAFALNFLETGGLGRAEHVLCMNLVSTALHRLQNVISEFRAPSGCESGEATLQRLHASRAIRGCAMISDDPAPGPPTVFQTSRVARPEDASKACGCLSLRSSARLHFDTYEQRTLRPVSEVADMEAPLGPAGRNVESVSQRSRGYIFSFPKRAQLSQNGVNFQTQRVPKWAQLFFGGHWTESVCSKLGPTLLGLQNLMLLVLNPLSTRFSFCLIVFPCLLFHLLHFLLFFSFCFSLFLLFFFFFFSFSFFFSIFLKHIQASFRGGSGVRRGRFGTFRSKSGPSFTLFESTFKALSGLGGSGVRWRCFRNFRTDCWTCLKTLLKKIF